MGFWGVEVKPGKPHPYHSDNVQGSLYLTQATLGLGKSNERSILQCSAGHKEPVFLCSLLPGQSECCSLNLEFKDELVAFSVVGPRSIHLSGYFVSDEGDNLRDEYEYDSEEDIADTGSDYESSDYDEGYSDDSMEYVDGDDAEMFPPSPAHKSGVVIEEILDEDTPKDTNDVSKRKKRKKSENGKKDAEKQIVPKGGPHVSVLESEDEDGFPISAQQTAEVAFPSVVKEDLYEEPAKKQLTDDLKDVKNKKRKEQDHQPEVKKKNNKKPKGKADDVDSGKMDDKIVDNSSQPEDANKQVSLDEANSTSSDKKVKKNKKKKKSEQKEEGKTENQASSDAGDGGNASLLSEEKQSTAKSSQVRTFSNGLVIEEMKIGVPDGKRASDGSKVVVRYIGRLKKNGKIFDSNVSGKPFEFRLGVGQVIKGWDVGVKGMRVGDKRRLTIPPSMGYGAKGAPPQIPPNAWLEFDVELVNVR